MEGRTLDRETRQRIAAAILMWLSNQEVSFRDVSDVLKELSSYLSGSCFDASSFFKEINTQQSSSLSNHAQSSKQESKGLHPTSGLDGKSFFDKLTALNIGQNLDDISDNNAENNEKATLFKKLGKCLGDTFIEFKIPFKEIEEITYHVNKLLRETIPSGGRICQSEK